MGAPENGYGVRREEESQASQAGGREAGDPLDDIGKVAEDRGQDNANGWCCVTDSKDKELPRWARINHTPYMHTHAAETDGSTLCWNGCSKGRAVRGFAPLVIHTPRFNLEGSDPGGIEPRQDLRGEGAYSGGKSS